MFHDAMASEVPAHIQEAQETFEGPQALGWVPDVVTQRLFAQIKFLTEQVRVLALVSGLFKRAEWIEFASTMTTPELERYLQIPRAVRDDMMAHVPAEAWHHFCATMEEVEAASGKRESAR